MALDRDKILQTAQKHVDKKRFDKALAEYRKLVAEDPSDVRTLLKVGDLHLKLDQHEDAITTYEQVGNYYYREGFSVKAIAVYKQIRGIIRRHAPHLEGRYGHIVPRLAEIYTQLGLTSDALAAYDEVATRLRGEGRERDALDIFKKVVELDPQNPIAHLRVADSRARLGDMDKAIERFGEAAEIMVKLGRLEDAIKVLERLLEYRRDPLYARRAAQLYLERGGPNDGMAALTKLQVAFKNDPKDLETLEMLAVAFDAINQPNKAVEVLKEAARVANEAGDEARFSRFLDTLLSRAPEDTLVVKLDKSRRAEANRTADVEVEVLEPEFVEENIEEVFELEDGEVETHHESAEIPPEEPEVAARRLLYEAERQRTAGQLDAAIRLVRDGLRNLGSSRPLRERLSDLLLEAGDQHGATTEKLILAQELANEGVVEDAVRTLDEVLLLQPGNPDAIQMRTNLGYPLQTEQGIEDLTLNQPLQSYDVESGGVAEALHRSRHNSSPAMPALDDPFVPTNTGAHPQTVDPTAGYTDPNAAHHAQPQAAPHAPAAHYDRPSGYDHAPYSQPYSQPVVSQTGQSLDEGALDQAEVLAEQGRYDEARAILYQQLQALPNHPLVLDRLADLDAMAAHATASHSGDYSRPSHAPYSSQHPPSSYPQGGYDQVPQSQQRMGQQHVPPHAHVSRGQQAWGNEVDSLLDQVRQGVASQVDEGDAATHYDLGVAYQEMGLQQDAISELMLASRDPARECVCLSMVGTIQLQMGDYEAALDALHRALNTQYKTRDQELAVGYEIANTYDAMQMPEQALQYFEWLAQVDPNYSDPRGSIYDRIQRLRTESGALPRPQAPAPAPPSADELNDAFGDAFEEG